MFEVVQKPAALSKQEWESHRDGYFYIICSNLILRCSSTVIITIYRDALGTDHSLDDAQQQYAIINTRSTEIHTF
jgi:hypothetical protein